MADTLETNKQPAPIPPTGESELRPSRWFWLLMLLSMLAVGGVAYLQYSRVNEARTGRYTAVEAPPIIAKLPDFSLTERSGKSVALADLQGQTWLANFIFTTCGGPCPIMTNRVGDIMQTLRERNIKNVRAVSFTVDPQTDTPAVLREYATMKLADQFDWWFLTGDQKAIHELSVKGFMLTAQPGDESHTVDHSPRLVLVDPQGRIRGYYEIVTDEEILAEDPGRFIGRPTNPDTKEQLIKDILKIQREERPSK